MVARQRHFAGTDEVEVVVGQVVDLGGVLAEEAGAAHDLGTHQRRRDHGDEAGFERTLETEVHQRELQACADSGEEGEACPRDLRAALHVDRTEQFAQREVVARLEVECGRLAVRAQGDEVLFATGGHSVEDDVLDGRKGEVGCFFRRGDRVLGELDALAQLFRLRNKRGLLFFGRLSDELAVGILRRTEIFERSDGSPARGVGGERGIHRVSRLPTRLLRALDQLRIFAKKYGIDHPSSLVRTPVWGLPTEGLSLPHDHRCRR